MVILQAAIGLGLLLMFIFKLLIFLVLPLITLILIRKHYKQIKSENLRPNTQQVLFIILKSILISIGLTIMGALIIFLILYLTVDLTYS